MPFINTIGQAQCQVVVSTTKPSHKDASQIYTEREANTDDTAPRFLLDVNANESSRHEKAQAKRKQEKKKYASEQAEKDQRQAEEAARHTVDEKTVTALRTMVQSALKNAKPNESGDALAGALKLASALLSLSQGANNALPAEALQSRQELNILQGQIRSNLHQASDKLPANDVPINVSATNRHLLA